MATNKDSISKQAQEAMKSAADLKREAEAAEKAARMLISATGGRVGDFMSFVREQGVVGMAVGLAIGTAAGATVKQIVEGFINPAITLLVGSQEDLMKEKWKVVIKESGREVEFAWGAVLSSVITLLATALVIYLVVRVVRLDRLDKKKEQK